MIIAAAINKEEEIVPIVEGDVLRILNVATKRHEDFHNPALDVAEGRRGAALRFVQKQAVNAFAAPSETFCDLSYQAAKKAGIRFLKVEEKTPFANIPFLLEERKFTLPSALPEADILKVEQA